jgi:SPP1 family predicted phage head-tail adaptor
MPSKAQSMILHQDPGVLNRKILIQQPINTPDGAGGQTTTWTTIFTVFAAIAPSHGSEAYFAMQLYPHAQYMITIRWRYGVLPGYRVVANTHTMRIRSMTDPMMAHVFIQMLCEELQAEGIVK